MGSDILEQEALKKALRKAYLAKETEVSEGQWQDKVMGRVRHIGSLRHVTSFLSAFEHMVWRLAPASALLILSLTVLLLNMDFDPDYDYLGTLTPELDKPALTEFLDLEG